MKLPNQALTPALKRNMDLRYLAARIPLLLGAGDPEVWAGARGDEADDEFEFHEDLVFQGSEGGEVEGLGVGEGVDGEGGVVEWHFE